MLLWEERRQLDREKGEVRTTVETDLNWLTTVCATFCDGVVQIGNDVLVMLSAV